VCDWRWGDVRKIKLCAFQFTTLSDVCYLMHFCPWHEPGPGPRWTWNGTQRCLIHTQCWALSPRNRSSMSALTPQTPHSLHTACPETSLGIESNWRVLNKKRLLSVEEKALKRFDLLLPYLKCEFLSSPCERHRFPLSEPAAIWKPHVLWPGPRGNFFSKNLKKKDSKASH
jgi:hypothetical protein